MFPIETLNFHDFQKKLNQRKCLLIAGNCVDGKPFYFNVILSSGLSSCFMRPLELF